MPNSENKDKQNKGFERSIKVECMGHSKHCNDRMSRFESDSQWPMA